MSNNDKGITCAVTGSTATDYQAGLALIQGRGVSFTFEGKEPVQAADELNFAIQQNHITAIIGESGSGKSTLLKLIYGLYGPQQGDIRYKGIKIPDPAEKLIPGHEAMRMVSQSFDDLNTYANVWDNVASQLSNTDLKVKHERTQAVLEQLRISHLKNQRIFDLSGGEKQRVAIAVALINEPEVLLLDEPFNQIDASFREVLQDDIRDIVDQTGLTVILVSHDPAEVLSLANHLLIMRKGHIVAQGSPQELYERAPEPYTAKLLSRANILTSEQAAILGIESPSSIGIHLNHIGLDADPSGEFRIKSKRFKGFFDEIVLDNQGIELRCIHNDPGKFKQNQKIRVHIESYWPFLPQ